jgi:hypothetical protein
MSTFEQIKQKEYDIFHTEEFQNYTKDVASKLYEYGKELNPDEKYFFYLALLESFNMTLGINIESSRLSEIESLEQQNIL